VHKADNLTPSCAVVTRSGNLNFLEPSGPFEACNGTAFSTCSAVSRSSYTTIMSICSIHLRVVLLDQSVYTCYAVYQFWEITSFCNI